MPRAHHAAYVLALILACLAPAFVIGHHPDEISRSMLARSFMEHGEFIEHGQYSRYWPPLMLWLDCLAQLLGTNYRVARFIFFLPFLPLIWILASRAMSSGWQYMLALLIVMPYAGLCVATRSPQGLQLILLGYLLWMMTSVRDTPVRTVLATVLLALVYLCNPALVLITFLASMAMLAADRKAAQRLLRACVMAYILCTPYVIWSLWSANIFVPTFATTGPMNLWLGNNIDPMSYRGMGTIDAWGQGGPDFLGMVMTWAASHPADFLANFLRKVLNYWSPMDHFRSNAFNRFGLVLFAYVGLAQLVIYTLFYRAARRGMTPQQLVTLMLCLAAWGVYSLFFVKIRFRIPFDMLLLMSVIWMPRSWPSRQSTQAA